MKQARPVFLLILRLLIGGVLFYAGLMKALGPSAEFAAAIETYHLLPAALITPLALGLPWIEMWVGIFLAAGFQRRLAAAAALVLFIVFLTAVGSALARGLDLSSCGCFGADAMAPKHTLILDSVLAFLTIMLLAFPERRPLFALDTFLSKD